MDKVSGGRTYWTGKASIHPQINMNLTKITPDMIAKWKSKH